MRSFYWGKMPVEAKIACSDIKEVTKTYSPIEPGESIFVEPFDDAIVTVECATDDLYAKAIVNPLVRKFIRAAIFTFSGELLRDADVNEPIYFGQGERIAIYSSGCKQEVWLHHIQGSEVDRFKTIQRNAVARRNMKRKHLYTNVQVATEAA
jgi:hypothetical protein